MKRKSNDVKTKDSGILIGDSVTRIGMEKKGIYEITALREVYFQLKSKTTGKIVYKKVNDIQKLSGDQAVQSTSVAVA